MPCHYCSKYGHKRNDCPERKNKTIKCYECGTFGHYKNDCPIVRERVRIQREQEYAEQTRLNKIEADAKYQTAVEFVMKYYPEDASKALSNMEDIHMFIKTSRLSSLMLTLFLNSTDEKLNTPVKMQLYDGKILSYGNEPLNKFLHHISIDDFLLFISHRPVFSKLTYDVSKTSLRSMIYDMAEQPKSADTGVADRPVKTVVTEPNRENEYYIGKKKVMKSRRHSTDWRSRVEELQASLIISTYDEYKNDGLVSIGGSIDFIYNEVAEPMLCRTGMMVEEQYIPVCPVDRTDPMSIETSSSCCIQ